MGSQKEMFQLFILHIGFNQSKWAIAKVIFYFETSFMLI